MMPAFCRSSGLATRSHLLGGQLEPGQEGEQVAARLLVSRPALARLLQPALYRFSSHFWRPSRIAWTYSQAFSPLFSSGTKTCRWKAVPPLAAEVLKHAADARERPTVLPDLGEHVVEPDEMPVPLPGDFALVLDRLNRLQQPLQRTDRHVVAEMLGDVGEVHHRPFRDKAEDVLRVVTAP